MNPIEIEAMILSALTNALPKAERKRRQAQLKEDAAARAQMAEAEIASLMAMGLSRYEAWSEAARIYLKP